MRIATTASRVAIAFALLTALAVAADPRRPESDPGKSKGWGLGKSLAGYSQLRKRFQIDDITVGSVNRIDPALFTRLQTLGEGGLNAAWWWNPLNDDKPRYTWSDFIACFDRASEVVRQHTWLLDWQEAGPGRALELHAFGCEPASDDFMMDYFVHPLWRDAALGGKPGYEVLARRGNAEWARIFLSDSEPRALVSYTMGAHSDGEHWLDRLEVSFHPRCATEPKNARYATVTQSGEVEPRVFASCEP